LPCSSIQPTLTGPGRDLSDKTRSLDLLRLAAWYAFELATTTRAPVSTSPTLTYALLELLEDSGVLTSTAHGEGARRALYDPISWNYHQSWPKTAPVLAVVRDALIARVNEPASAQTKLQLWTHLAEAEAENYLAHLCIKHGLKVPDPGAVIDKVGDEWNKHCLARKRYLLWAATKAVGTGQLVGDSQELELAYEIKLRSEWLTSQFSSGRAKRTEYCFIPNTPLRTPTLLQAMQEYVLPLGEKYWMEIPREYFQDKLMDET
jgi:hypothetical protein